MSIQPFLAISGKGFAVLRDQARDMIPALAFFYVHGDRDGMVQLTERALTTFAGNGGFPADQVQEAVRLLAETGGCEDLGNRWYRLDGNSFVITNKTLIPTPPEEMPLA